MADTLAWLAKAIGTSKSLRYKEFLSRLYQSENSIEKLDKYIDGSIKNLSLKSSEKFVESESFVEIMRAKLLRTPSFKAFKQVDFLSIKKGYSFDRVIDSLGYPSDMGLAASKVRGHWGVRTRGIYLQYDGYGVINLYINKNNSNQWLVDSVSNIDLLVSSASGSKKEKQALYDDLSLILGSDENAIRKKINGFKTPDKFNTLLLDAAIERVYQTMDTKSKWEADALAKLCLYIGRSNNGRYVELLKYIEKHGATDSLTDHAEDAYEDIEDYYDDNDLQNNAVPYKPNELNIGIF